MWDIFHNVVISGKRIYFDDTIIALLWLEQAMKFIFLLNGIKAQYESKISMLKTIPHKK